MLDDFQSVYKLMNSLTMYKKKKVKVVQELKDLIKVKPSFVGNVISKVDDKFILDTIQGKITSLTKDEKVSVDLTIKYNPKENKYMSFVRNNTKKPLTKDDLMTIFLWISFPKVLSKG